MILTNFPAINEVFYQIYAAKMTINVFEQWVYAHEESLEKILPENDAFNLISLNYRDKYAHHEIEKLVYPFIDFRLIEKAQMMEVLNAIREANDTTQIVNALEQSYDFYSNGYYFFQTLALDYYLKIIELECEEYQDIDNFLAKQKLLVQSFYPTIIQESQKIYESLQNNTIVFENRFSERGNLIYTSHSSD